MIANEYTVTKQLYLEWYSENKKKGLQRKITIMWIAILVILLIATLFYAISPHDGDTRPWLAIEGALMIYSIYHLFFRRKIAEAAMYDKLAGQLGENWTKTIVFEEDGIRTIEGSLEVKYPYDEIVSVRSIGDEIEIETDTQLDIRLYKDKFVSGDYPRFKRFIESKVVNRCFLN